MKYTDKVKEKENILILLLSSAYISISLFEIFIVLFLIYELYLFGKKQIKVRGVFTVPLFLIIIPSLLSSIIYGNIKDITGALNQNFFNISYFAKDIFKSTEKLFIKLNYTVVLFCSVEAIVTAYNYLRGLEKPIWGGVFEIGIVFALGSISAFILFLYEKDYKKKSVFFILFLIFTFFVFYTGKRNPILGIIAIYILLFIKLFKFSNISKKLVVGFAGVFLIIVVAGTFIAVNKFPKYKLFFEVITFQKVPTEAELNSFSSARWEIGKKGLEVIKKDIEEKNILPLFIGHGFNSGYRLNPPSPVGRTYESIFFISELIQKGIIGLLGIILMMVYYFRFVFKVKLKEFNNIIALPFLLFPSYFLIGGIFSGMWDAILPLYLLLFGISENYYKEVSKDL
jgi:hypothetical protein